MLFNSVILEVAIGLFFIYLVTSLICSGISELIAGLANLRGRRLQEGIRNLLLAEDNAGLIRDFYNSTLVRGLFTPSLWDSIRNGLRGSKRKSPPSYIPANIFARVLREVLAGESGAVGLTKDWHEVWDYLIQKKEASQKDPAQELSPAQLELLGVLKTAGLDGERATRLKSLQAQLVMARRALRDFAAPSVVPVGMLGQYLLDRVTQLEKSVQQAEKEVNDALERAQLYVEDYFNQAMERVSGWYKRNVQLVLAVIAIIVTLALNIDSLYIIDVLMKSPTIRAAVDEMATEHVNAVIAQQATAAAATAPTAASATPASAAAATPVPDAPNEGTSSGGTSAIVTPPLKTLDEIKAVGLNLGWDRCLMPESVHSWIDKNVMREDKGKVCPGSNLSRLTDDPAIILPRPTDGPAMWAIKKFLGLLLTVIAASLGAPFWFDLLNKAVNLRLTGQKPPEKSVTAQNPPAV